MNIFQNFKAAGSELVEAVKFCAPSGEDWLGLAGLGTWTAVSIASVGALFLVTHEPVISGCGAAVVANYALRPIMNTFDRFGHHLFGKKL